MLVAAFISARERPNDEIVDMSRPSPPLSAPSRSTITSEDGEVGESSDFRMEDSRFTTNGDR